MAKSGSVSSAAVNIVLRKSSAQRFSGSRNTMPTMAEKRDAANADW